MNNLNRVFTENSNKLVISDEIDSWLLEGGFEYDTHWGELSLYKGIWSKGDFYLTRINITSTGIYFYKEYNCGGEVCSEFNEWSNGDIEEVIKKSIESFDFD